MAGFIPIAEQIAEEAEPILVEAGEEIAAEAEVLAPKVEAAAEAAVEAVEAAGEKVAGVAEAGLEKLGEIFDSLLESAPEAVAECPEVAEAEAELAEAETAEAEEALNEAGGKFADEAKLQDHFDRHGGDFGASTPAEYEQQADEFLNGEKAAETLEKVRPNGDVVRYNPDTDEFGIVKPDGTIRTYYEPDPAVHGYPSNLDYFNAQ